MGLGNPLPQPVWLRAAGILAVCGEERYLSRQADAGKIMDSRLGSE